MSHNLDETEIKHSFLEEFLIIVAQKFFNLAEWQFGKLPIAPSSIDLRASHQPSQIIEQATIVRTQTGMQVPPNIRRWIAQENLSPAYNNLVKQVVSHSLNQDFLESSITSISEVVQNNIASKNIAPSHLISHETIDKWIRSIATIYLLEKRDSASHQIPSQRFHEKAIAILSNHNPEKWKEWSRTNNITANSFYNLKNTQNILQNYLDNFTLKVE